MSGRQASYDCWDALTASWNHLRSNMGDDPPPRATCVSRVGQAGQADDLVAVTLRVLGHVVERAGTAVVQEEDSGHSLGLILGASL